MRPHFDDGAIIPAAAVLGCDSRMRPFMSRMRPTDATSCPGFVFTRPRREKTDRIRVTKKKSRVNEFVFGIIFFLQYSRVQPPSLFFFSKSERSSCQLSWFVKKYVGEKSRAFFFSFFFREGKEKRKERRKEM